MKMPKQGFRHIMNGGRSFWVGTVLALAGAWTTAHAATDCNAVTQIPKAQCGALVSLYTSTDGAKWKDAATNNWNVTNTPCSWTGVVCSGSNVTELKRASAGLAGPLPDLSALTGLQNLWLNSNTALTGDVAILKGLTNLRILYLGYTGLRGFLGDLSPLTQLEELVIDVVPLGTPMPDLASFKKLRILSIWQSGMVGLIPASLSSLTNLERLNLGYNRSLTGNIPNLSALTKLSYLDLSVNNLTGNIPDLSNLIRLGYAYLNNNQLSGDIPASLGGLFQEIKRVEQTKK